MRKKLMVCLAVVASSMLTTNLLAESDATPTPCSGERADAEHHRNLYEQSQRQLAQLEQTPHSERGWGFNTRPRRKRGEVNQRNVNYTAASQELRHCQTLVSLGGGGGGGGGCIVEDENTNFCIDSDDTADAAN